MVGNPISYVIYFIKLYFPYQNKRKFQKKLFFKLKSVFRLQRIEEGKHQYATKRPGAT